jgi:four helix bundle protein
VRDIEARTFRFSVAILKMVKAMPNSIASNVIARQIMRAGTSVGANVEEAQGAPSKKDFTRRMNIARAEAREVLYWLRLLKETDFVAAGIAAELSIEADQLVRILTAIVKNSRQPVSSSS